MTDQIIASDLLIAVKSAVRNYSFALTEAASPEVRKVLRSHLEDAIHVHEQVTQYMMDRGWYKAYQMKEQIMLDIQNASTALSLSQA